MHLKSLTLKGFKSFASATTLRLEPGITCVVGPNGSGKSNVVDAISWVLGEQGAKALRGGKMEDVIFAGTSGRAPLGRAEVTLTIDNSDGALPIDYSEVSITRRMFRDGAGEYEINGTALPAARHPGAALATPASAGRCTSSSGRASSTRCCSRSPEDRRAYIEEAAGVLKHRKRKEKALRKLDAMQANLTRLTDLTARAAPPAQAAGPAGRDRAAGAGGAVRAARRPAAAAADDLVTLRDELAREEADEAARGPAAPRSRSSCRSPASSRSGWRRALAEDAPRLAAAQDTWYRLSALAERLARHRPASPRSGRATSRTPARRARRGATRTSWTPRPTRRRAGGRARRGGRGGPAGGSSEVAGGARRARDDARRGRTRPPGRRPRARRPPGRARHARRPGRGAAQRRRGHRRGDRAAVRGAGRGGGAHRRPPTRELEGAREELGARRRGATTLAGASAARRARSQAHEAARGAGGRAGRGRSGRPSSSARTGGRGWRRCRSGWPAATARAPARRRRSERRARRGVAACSRWSRTRAPRSRRRWASSPTRVAGRLAGRRGRARCGSCAPGGRGPGDAARGLTRRRDRACSARRWGRPPAGQRGPADARVRAPAALRRRGAPGRCTGVVVVDDLDAARAAVAAAGLTAVTAEGDVLGPSGPPADRAPRRARSTSRPPWTRRRPPATASRRSWPGSVPRWRARGPRRRRAWPT